MVGKWCWTRGEMVLVWGLGFLEEGGEWGDDCEVSRGRLRVASEEAEGLVGGGGMEPGKWTIGPLLGGDGVGDFVLLNDEEETTSSSLRLAKHWSKSA